MDSNRTVPIIVSVTGYRVLQEKDIPTLRNAVKQELQKIQALCPNSRLILMTCLAEGADMLCADVAEEMNIPLYAALPMKADVYCKDFPEAEKIRFCHHCNRAERVFVTPATEPEPATLNRNYLFRQADIYIVNHCHVLLALWNGEKGKPGGCGAAETVEFSLSGNYETKSGISYRSGSNEAVIHIFTPRGARTEELAGTVRVKGNGEAVKDIIVTTDHFNKLALEVKTRDDRTLLPKDFDKNDAILCHMEKMYRVSDDLSVESAERYRGILKKLAIANTIITLAFLMYDEAEATWLILVCGAVLFGAWFCHRYAVKTDCHNRYIEYRVLAESIRVQAYLRYAGSSLQVATLLPWSQQEETAWIVDALNTINVGENPKDGKRIRDCWVKQQLDYHINAYDRTKKNNKSSEKIVNTALCISFALYIFALLFELLFGGLIFEPRLLLADEDFYRTILKVLLGTISAGTIFGANYYGKLSPQRKLSDHKKMEHFYGKIHTLLADKEEEEEEKRKAEQREQIDIKKVQPEELLKVLAVEELIENGNWCSYQRDNTPDINL